MVTNLRAKPWLLIALFVSLVLNLFLGGIVAGRIASGSPIGGPGRAWSGGSDHGEGPARQFMQRMAASLPSEYRPSFEAVVAKHRPNVSQAGSRVREARAKVREAMLKEPFERAALEAAFADLRTRSDALQAALHAAIVEGAADLPPDARQRLADWRSHPRGR